MGRKIFVSYKYSDSLVQDLNIYVTVNPLGYPIKIKVPTTARHYVDKLTEILKDCDNIYKGENDNESMESLADSTIGSKLGDKIYDSSITIVLISKGMKSIFLPEKDQWIPWEISYSLKEQSRQGIHSKTNGVIAVVLPDESGNYEYYLTYDSICNCTTHNTPILFQILRENMFNQKQPEIRICNGKNVYQGDFSYIQSVKWTNFEKDPNLYIDKAVELRDKKEQYNLRKNV